MRRRVLAVVIGVLLLGSPSLTRSGPCDGQACPYYMMMQMGGTCYWYGIRCMDETPIMIAISCSNPNPGACSAPCTNCVATAGAPSTTYLGQSLHLNGYSGNLLPPDNDIDFKEDFTKPGGGKVELTGALVKDLTTFKQPSKDKVYVKFEVTKGGPLVVARVFSMKCHPEDPDPKFQKLKPVKVILGWQVQMDPVAIANVPMATSFSKLSAHAAEVGIPGNDGVTEIAKATIILHNGTTIP